MDTKNFTKVRFHHLIILIERDDGNKKNKTLKKGEYKREISPIT